MNDDDTFEASLHDRTRSLLEELPPEQTANSPRKPETEMATAHRPAEADTVAKLRDYFDQLMQAQCEFEELWFASGEGEHLPPANELRRLLRRIAGRANLLELSFVWLRMQREMPEPAKSLAPAPTP